MTDYARDVLNWGSFGIGIVSLLVSAVGLYYSILSWLVAGQARTAAEAAREAADEARAESRRRFEAFAAGKLRDHVLSTLQHLHKREWGKAAILLREVGQDVGHFTVQDQTWTQHTTDLLDMANSCNRWDVIGSKKGFPKKWTFLLNDVLSRLPTYQTPI